MKQTHTLSNADLLSLQKALAGLSQIRLPVRASYAISRTVRLLEGALGAYEEARMRLIEEHAEADAEGRPQTSGGRYVLRDEGAFQAAHAELLGIETEAEVYTVPLDALAAVEIEPATLAPLVDVVVVAEP